jgi:N-acetylneuraminic acid mutarotase
MAIGRILGLVVALWLAGESIPALAEGAWSELQPLPEARQEFPAVLLDGRIYTAGGMMNFTAAAVNRFESYDIRSNRWQRLADLPLAVHHTAMASVGGRIYVLGGATGTSTPSDRVFAYDPEANTWSEKARLPRVTWAATAVTWQERIYLISGTAASSFSSNPGVPHTQVYSPGIDSWSTNYAPIPLPRNHMAAVRIGTQVYVSPGRSANAADQADRRFHRYDLVRNLWTELAPLPEFYRSGSAMAQVHGTLYFIGGEGSGPVLNKVHAYDPGSNAWRRVPDLPEGRHGMGAVTVGNVLYVPGGGFQNGIGPSARVFAFAVPQADPLSFEVWARGFFSSGDPASGADHDFDGDGLTNFEEFALNLDPGVISVTPRPRLRRGEANQFTLEYERGRGRAVQWDLLISTNLTEWNLAVPAVDWAQSATTDLGLGTERVSVEIFPRGRDRLFLRLKPGLSQ